MIEMTQGETLNGATVRRTESARNGLSILLGLEGLALGGCPINALDLGRTLRERGHIVSVFAVQEDVRVSMLPYAKKCGFDPILIPPTDGIVTRARQIRDVADSVDAKVVHVFGPWMGPAATIAGVGRPNRATIVTNWTMSNVPFTPRYTPMIVGTQRLQAEAQVRHHSRVWLMEPPVDTRVDAPDVSQGRAFRQELGLGASEVLAVIVGRLDSDMKAEGIGYAMQACGRLDDPRLRMVIVGDGNAFQEIQQRALALNADLGRDVIMLTGARHDPRSAYDAADVVLGMGGSAIRGLAHGKPLVVLGVNGFSRTFTPQSMDFFYDVGFFGDELAADPVGELTDQLRNLMQEAIRAELGEFGLAQVGGRFSLDASTTKLEEIYHHTLASGPPALTSWVSAVYVAARTLAHQGRRSLASTRR